VFALAPTNAFSGSEELAVLRGRLNGIEQKHWQARMAAEIKVIVCGTVQAAAANLNNGGGDPNGIEVTAVDEGGEPEKDPVTVKLEELEKKLNDLDAAFKLE
jgi:hypothetical protein